MALERIDQGLWAAAAPTTFLGLHLGTRMTVVRLSGGGLFLHSVVPMTGPRRALGSRRWFGWSRGQRAAG